jgi:hypothetical protein
VAFAFGGMWIVALATYTEVKAEALVFPGAAVLWLATTVYLIFLGLLAETLLSSNLDPSEIDPMLRRLS